METGKRVLIIKSKYLTAASAIILGIQILGTIIEIYVNAVEVINSYVSIYGSIFIVLAYLLIRFIIKSGRVRIVKEGSNSSSESDSQEQPHKAASHEEDNNSSHASSFEEQTSKAVKQEKKNNLSYEPGISSTVLYICIGMIILLWLPRFIKPKTQITLSGEIVSTNEIERFRSKVRTYAIRLERNPVDEEINLLVKDSLFPLVKNVNENPFYEQNYPFEVGILYRTYGISLFLKSFGEGKPNMTQEIKLYLERSYVLLDSLFKNRRKSIGDNLYNQTQKTFDLFEDSQNRIENELANYIKSIESDSDSKQEKITKLKKLVLSTLPIAMLTSNKESIEKRFCIIFPCDKAVVKCSSTPDCIDTIPCSDAINFVLNYKNINNNTLRNSIEQTVNYFRAKGLAEAVVMPKCRILNNYKYLVFFDINENVKLEWMYDNFKKTVIPYSSITRFYDELFLGGALNYFESQNLLEKFGDSRNDYEEISQIAENLMDEGRYVNSIIYLSYLVNKYPQKGTPRYNFSLALGVLISSEDREVVKIAKGFGCCYRIQAELKEYLMLDPNGEFYDYANEISEKILNDPTGVCSNCESINEY